MSACMAASRPDTSAASSLPTRLPTECLGKADDPSGHMDERGSPTSRSSSARRLPLAEGAPGPSGRSPFPRPHGRWFKSSPQCPWGRHSSSPLLLRHHIHSTKLVSGHIRGPLFQMSRVRATNATRRASSTARGLRHRSRIMRPRGRFTTNSSWRITLAGECLTRREQMRPLPPTRYYMSSSARGIPTTTQHPSQSISIRYCECNLVSLLTSGLLREKDPICFPPPPGAY